MQPFGVQELVQEEADLLCLKTVLRVLMLSNKDLILLVHFAEDLHSELTASRVLQDQSVLSHFLNLLFRVRPHLASLILQQLRLQHVLWTFLQESKP